MTAEPASQVAPRNKIADKNQRQTLHLKEDCYRFVILIYLRRHKTSVLSDFFKVCFWEVLILLVLGMPKEKVNNTVACFQVTGSTRCRVRSFCIHENGEINLDFWLAEGALRNLI